MDLINQIFRIFRRKFILIILVINVTSLCLLFRHLSFTSFTSEKYSFLYNFEEKHGHISDIQPSPNVGESKYNKHNAGLIPHVQANGGITQRSIDGNVPQRSNNIGGILKEHMKNIDENVTQRSKGIDGIVKQRSYSTDGTVKQHSRNIDGIVKQSGESISKHDAIQRHKPVDDHQRADDKSSDVRVKK